MALDSASHSAPTTMPAADFAASSATAPPLAIEAAGVCRRYGPRWALVNVDVAVPRGAALLVAGRNGSGKSTLFRVLSTLLRPDRGTTRVCGLDPRTDLLAVRSRVALLSHPSHHYEALTALENLRVAARFLALPADRTSLLPHLHEVGLAERADDAISTFSAGMRKRLTLARTLLKGAEIVFLDEPYGQLDPPGFRLVDTVITGLRARGTTVLLATHLLDRGAALCDYGLALDAGRVLFSGAAADLERQSGLDTAHLPEVGG
jgi:ABC-type multidrug transport system ATPase subunit